MVLQTKGSLFENRSHDALPWSVPDAFRKHMLKKYYGWKGATNLSILLVRGHSWNT